MKKGITVRNDLAYCDPKLIKTIKVFVTRVLGHENWGAVNFRRKTFCRPTFGRRRSKRDLSTFWRQNGGIKAASTIDCIGKMSVSQMYVGKMSMPQMYASQIYVNLIFISQTFVNLMSVSQMSVGKMSVGQMSVTVRWQPIDRQLVDRLFIAADDSSTGENPTSHRLNLIDS